MRPIASASRKSRTCSLNAPRICSRASCFTASSAILRNKWRRNKMTLLAIETSCDETSAAVVRDGRILSNAVSSQIELHAEYGGVVPELAAREHLKNLLPVAKAALGDAEVSADQLDAVAATQGPGLPMALLVGLKAAQAVAFALRKPFVGIHHHEAHLYSPWIITTVSPLSPPPATPSPPAGDRDGVRGGETAKHYAADFS